jgi:hypothetical protein
MRRKHQDVPCARNDQHGQGNRNIDMAAIATATTAAYVGARVVDMVERKEQDQKRKEGKKFPSDSSTNQELLVGRTNRLNRRHEHPCQYQSCYIRPNGLL